MSNEKKLLAIFFVVIIIFGACNGNNGGKGDDPVTISSNDHEDYNCHIEMAGRGLSTCDNKLNVVFSDWGNGRCKKRTVTFRITNPSSTEIKLSNDVLVIKEEDYYQTWSRWLTEELYIPYTVPNNQNHPISFKVEMKNVFKKDEWQDFYDVIDNTTSDYSSNCI